MQRSIVDPVATTHRGLSVYQRAYNHRMHEALALSYPALALHLGDEAFASVCRAYMQRHPSRETSIRWYGGSFAHFLQDAHEDYLAELARWEWAMGCLFDAGDAPVLAATQVAELACECWPTLSFICHPSLSLITNHFDTVPFWQALLNHDTAKPPSRLGGTTWMLWRHQKQLLYQPLSAMDAWMLHHLQQGFHFGALLLGMMQWFDHAEVGAEAAQRLFTWLEQGILSKVFQSNEPSH